MSAKSITFNGFDLQDSDFRTKDIIYRNIPNKIIDIEPFSRRDGFRFVNSYYDLKDITINGTLTKNTAALLKTSIDSMKESLNASEANLDIDDGGTTLRYVCTVSSIDVPEQHYHITRIPYSITFRCQPFGKETTSTSSSDTITASSADPFITTINPTGSIAPTPVITFSVVGTPSAAITAISYTNSSSGDTISVTGLALDANGDYLKIDTDLMKATYSTNGGSTETETDYTGIFPSFVVSNNTNSVSITGGGATWELTQDITYTPTYL